MDVLYLDAADPTQPMATIRFGAYAKIGSP